MLGAMGSFEYKESDTALVLTNDYPYADGNYLSRAVYTMRLNREGGSLTIWDINMDENGSGKCRLVSDPD